MKLWSTTTENKYFVKMLWHLLGECVKVTTLLVCSICTVHFFFFNHRFVLFFLYIKIANRLMHSVINSVFGLLTCLFLPFLFFKFTNLVWGFFFFFLRIFICLFCTCNVSLHCIHTKGSKYYTHLINSWTMLWIVFLV